MNKQRRASHILSQFLNFDSSLHLCLSDSPKLMLPYSWMEGDRERFGNGGGRLLASSSAKKLSELPPMTRLAARRKSVSCSLLSVFLLFYFG